MENEKTEEQETEELGEAPKEQIRVWGLGLTNNKLDKLINQNESMINLMRHIENKVESLMDQTAEERLKKIKRRF